MRQILLFALLAASLARCRLSGTVLQAKLQNTEQKKTEIE